MRRWGHFMIVTMLVSGLLQMVLTSNDLNVQADLAPPDDGVDGLQYIEGDWIVISPESYTDEIIVLSGNLTIEDGGSLTLRNVTLAINCTTSDSQFEVNVYDGGSLTITDFDGDPNTIYDNSNLTDSPFDVNDTGGSEDYEYTIRVYSGAFLSLTNSGIRECDIIQIQADDTEVQNCTFVDNNYPIWIMAGENNKIAYNDINNSDAGIYVQSNTNNTHIHNNDIHNNKFGILLSGTGPGVYTNNSIIHDNDMYDNDVGIYSIREITHGQIYDNEIHDNNFWGIEIRGKNSIVHDNNVHHNFGGMTLGGDDVTIYTNWIHNNTNTGVYLDELYNSNINTNTIENNSGTGDEHNLLVELCDNLQIHNNTIQWVKPGTKNAIKMLDNSNIDFMDNIVINNENAESTIRCEINTGNENIKFLNNYISNNIASGIHVIDSVPGRNNYIEIINNVLYENRGEGLWLVGTGDYTISDNTIITVVENGNGVKAIDVSNAGVFSNNTIIGKNWDFYLLGGTNLEVINCTCDPSKIIFDPGSSPQISFKYFLHVNVTDVWGAVPNAYVTIYNEQGQNVSFGHTDDGGFLRWILLTNQTQIGVGGAPKFMYYDPHNITATSGGYTAYGVIEPIMNRSQTVVVHFNVDLPPETPSNLLAISDWTDVELSWEPCHSPDLDHYLVYRNDTGVGWVLVYDSSTNPPYETWNNRTDPNAASDWTTYRYKVRAVDTNSQYSGFSNIASCGDWAIPDTREYVNFTVQLNGSLIVLPTGNLTFKNVTLNINCSYKAEFGIDVRPGGHLFILDEDDDPQTIIDRSNITALNPDYTIYFIVSGAKFEMRNSMLTYCGSDYMLDSGFWSVNKVAPKVVLEGEPWTRGLYVTGGDVTIENNLFQDNFVSLLLDGANGCNVIDNTFLGGEFGIYLHNAVNNTLSDNTLGEHGAYSIYLINSADNIVSSNNLTSMNEIDIVIYDGGCTDNTIIQNNISNSDYGIYFYDAGGNNNVTKNNFSYLGVAINIHNSHWNIFRDNKITNILGDAYRIGESDFSVISGEDLNWVDSAFNIGYSNHTTLSNLNIENVEEVAIGFVKCSGSVISNITIKYCNGAGIGFLIGNSHVLSDIIIENCYYGIFAFGYEVEGFSYDIELHNSTIYNNVHEAIWLWGCYDFLAHNSSLNAIDYDFNLSESSAISMNTTFNQTRVKINDSSLSIYWLMHVKVEDWLGNPEPNANVQIRKALGTLIYDGFTDVNGYVRWIWVHERTQYQYSNDSSNPHFIIAQSGNHSGSKTVLVNRSTQEVVYLENSLPSASNVIISPSYPTTIDDLTLTYQYSDPEDDPEGNTMIKWYVDGAYNSIYDNLLIIDNTLTSKGQTWFCEVIPHDGTEYGITMPSIPVAIQNTKPEVSNVVIEETNPRSSDSLHVNYTYTDIDSDPETWSLHRWYVDNGSGWVYSGVDSMELISIHTKKGERWKCNVTPGDGDDYGEPDESPPVTINNSAPEVSDLNILPVSPKSNETLWASYNYYDLDNDPESGSMIQWFRNDVEQTGLTGSFSVDPSKTAKDDKWYYIITPSDGEDFGDARQSGPFYIENTPPQVSNIIIQPDNPSTEDDLTVSYEFFDADGDEEGFDTIVEWLLWSGIEFIHTGLKVRTLSSSYTSKGETWICEVTPHDNYTYGDTIRCGQSVSILNSKPYASNVHITPSAPPTDADLVANYDYLDLDNDLENGSEIIWYCNEVEMPQLNDQITVPHSLTQEGQDWHFTVRPKDGSTYGDLVESADVTIQNSPPTATDLFISPTFPLGDDDLIASYTYFDEDGDAESNPEIRWYKNGLLQAFYDDQLEVGSEATEKGELWYYTLRVSDGVDLSEIMSSHYVVIENSKPVINSISPQPGSITLNETESLEFYVSAEDPDGDLLLYKWKLGKTTVSDDEYYLFSPDYESAGTYILNLTIQDVGERSFTLSYEWDITVNNENRLPQIEVKEPITKELKMKEDTSMKFLIDESDPDPEDVLQITWFFDDTVVQSAGSSYTYFADYSAAGEHVVTAMVGDGTDSVEYSWNLTVEDVQVGEATIYGLNWDQWSIILEFLVIAGTGILAFVGYNRLRRKKGALKEYMAEIDEVSTTYGDDPEGYEERLGEIETRINSEFLAGKIEDLHFHMLQDIIISRRGEVRRAEISQKFERLPEGIVKDLDEMLKDGKISRGEYENFVATISKSKSLSPREKEELEKVIGKWEVEDEDLVRDEPLAEKVKPRKSEIDEEIDDAPKSLDEEGKPNEN